VGNSGNITLTTQGTSNAAESINIGNGATLNASAPGHTAGNVTLTATSTVNKTWDPNNPDSNFNTDQANASITISPNAVIEGQNISITATADTSKTATVTENANGSQTQAPDALCVVFGGSGSCGSNTSPIAITDDILNLVGVGNYAGGVVSTATANIQVEGKISATGNVAIDSEASSMANFTANGLYITYAESDASATAQIQAGATINAAGNFNLTAHSVDNLTNTGNAVAGQSNDNNTVSQNGPAVVFTYSKADSTSVAGVESGATVDAGSVNVLAKNENSFDTEATPSVNGNGSSNQQYGAGAAIAISDTSSSADAHLNGTVDASGAITSNAESLDNKNQITSTAVVSGSSTDDNSDNSSAAQDLTSTAANDNSSSNSDGRAQTSGLDLGAAVAIVSSANSASSTVGANGSVTSGAGQNIDIEANASDTFKADASGSAAAASASIGGAVAVTNYSNSATASVGQNALVTAGGTLEVNAMAELPNDAASTLEGIESFLENFSISGSVSDLENVVNQATSSLSGLEGVINSIKNGYDNLKDGTTSSLSSTAQPGGGGVGAAGVVNILTANNSATAFIAQGAKVNAEAATVSATATTQSVNDAGTSAAQDSSDSDQNSTGSENSNSNPLGAFGGTYSGITYNNSATAYIADGASVTTTGGNVNVTSSATNFMANKYASGASAGSNIGISGAISNVTINSNSTAYLGDQAVVNADGNVTVDAENNTRVYELGDDTDSASNAAVGIVLSFLNVNDVTKSFIGASSTPGAYPAGHVDATGSVTVEANSYERLMTVAASSVSNGNSTENNGAEGESGSPSEGEQAGTNDTADSNSTTSPDSYSDGFGVSGEIALNNIKDTTEGYISNGATVSSASTSVSATDKSLMLAADGGLVRAGTAGLQGAFADNSIDKTTEAYTSDATLDTGSLSINANSSDLVIAASAGGAGSQGSSSVANLAGSVDYLDITNTTTASVDGTTVRGEKGGSTPTGAVTIGANNQETIFSVAGAFTYGSGDVGVGVALDIGTIDNSVTAGVDPASNIQSSGNVGVTASDNENQLSIAADLAVQGSNEIAASASYQSVTKNVQAYIDGTVNGTGTITVAAKDDQGGSSDGLPAGLIAIAGAIPVASGDAGLGASATVSTTNKTVEASIGNGADVTATGDVDVTAQTSDNLYLFAGGGAYGESVGFMGSAVVNTITNTTEATVGAATVSGDNVNVTASDTLNIIDGAGALSGSSSAAIGAAGDVEVIGTSSNPLTVTAAIAPNASVTASNNANVTATQSQSIVSVAVDGGASGDATVVGSGAVLNINTQTTAASNGNVGVGNVFDVNADRTGDITTVAGDLAISGNAGVGLSISFVDKTDSVDASIGGGTINAGGLQVSATGDDTLIPIAVGGAVTGSVSVAGSSVVNLLNPTTQAYIGGATINAGSQGASVDATSNTNITLSLVGVLSGGGDAGIGAAADVDKTNKTTTAEIESNSNVESTGNVLVAANSEESATSVGGVASIGEYAGVTGAASVYDINDTTQASINGGATVVANDSVGVSANDATDLNLLDGQISGGIAGVGAGLAFADVTKNTNALVDGAVTAKGHGSAINADNGTFSISYVPFGSGNFTYGSQVPNDNGNFTSNPMFGGQRSADPNTTAVNGLAVSATSTNDYNLIAAGAAGGAVGVTVNGSILLLNNNTKAELGSGADIGAGTASVLVAAGTDVGHIGSALGAAGGGVSVVPGFDVSLMNNNTTADVAGATITASDDVTVNANASEDILSLVAGVAYSGGAGVAGSLSFSHVTDTTTADVSGDSSVNAGGDLAVTSSDSTTANLLVGAVGLGDAYGVGASVAVDLVNKTTQAYFGNGTDTTAGGSSTVSANSAESLADGTVAGGAGGIAGAAGGVSVESDNSTTSAAVGTGTDKAGDGVNVSAANNADVTTFNGTIAGGLFAGLAGSVDVGNIENPTTAEISGANVTTTGGDVDVSASETRTINSTAISGSAGIAGIEASVIDWGVGAGVNTSGAGLTSGNPLNGGTYGGSNETVYGQADSQLSTALSAGSSMLNAVGNGTAGQQVGAAGSDLSAQNNGSPVSSAVTAAPPTQGTTAEIYGGSVNSAGAINVNSSDTTNLTMTAGGVSLGAIGLGASVDVASIDTSSAAEIMGGSQISAAGNVVIDATRNETLNGTALGGNAGEIFGGGAAVTDLNDGGTTNAEMDATVSQTSGLEITADTTRDASATSGQASAGFAAAGYSYASVEEWGSTKAQIDNGSSTLPAVQGVSVSADDDSAAAAFSAGISAGVVSVGGAEADTAIDPTVDAHIAGGATVDTAGNVQVAASTEEDANSYVEGVNAGGATVGTGSTANAFSIPTVEAYINGTVNAGGNVTLAARYNYTPDDQPLSTCFFVSIDCANVQAIANASAGSLAANINNGATTNALSMPNVTAFLNGANVTAGGTVAIYSESGSSVFADADASSETLGLDLGGDTSATATIINQNQASVANSTVNATNFMMSALSTDDASRGASASGSSLGLASFGNSTEATVNLGGTTESQLAGSSTINATENVTIGATVAEQANANASDGTNGFIGDNSVTASVGNPSGSVDTPTVDVQQGSTINATTSGTGATTIEADLTQALFNANSYSEMGAVGGGASATSNVNVTDDPQVIVFGNINSLQKLSIIATINSDPTATSINSTANSHLYAAGGSSDATANNYTDFEPLVTAGFPAGFGPAIIPTLTTDDLYIEATAPIPPASGSNPYYSQNAGGDNACLFCYPYRNNNGQYTINPGIILNATIYQPAGANPNISVAANGTITSNEPLGTITTSGNEVIIGNLVNQSTSSITLNTPDGFTGGSSTVHTATSWTSVNITNSSSMDLEVNNIQTVDNNSGGPTVNITSNPTLNNATFSYVTDNTTANINITNNSPTAATDIYLNGSINDPGGDVTMSALLGSILPLSSSEQTLATAISLTADHGNIGLSSDPLNLVLNTVENTSQVTGETASVNALAGQNLYLSLTGVESFQPGDSVPADVPVNLTSLEAGDNIGLTLNPATAYLNTANTVNGQFNLTGDITAGGNVLVNAPAQTTLNMLAGSTITSGFENIGFTVNADGTWLSTPIPVNYSSSINNGTVVMQNMQQQGGNVTIAGGGSLTGAGTIDVLNGYSNVSITNNSNDNLEINNLNFRTPVTGTVSIFGSKQTLAGTYTSGGANISLTETNNPTSTITINQNGTSGNLQLNGSILNPSGPSDITAANTNIVNTGGASELVESNSINLSAPDGHIGSSTTPINIQVGNGDVTANASGDIALDQTAGNMNVGTVDSTDGNVYLTAAGSILNGNTAAGNVNITGQTIDLTAGASIGASGIYALTVNTDSAAGGLKATALGNIFITDPTLGNFYIEDVTSTDGNVTLASGGTTDLGVVNALAGNTTITAGGSILNGPGASASINTQGISLTATNGSIGSLGTFLRIHSNAGTTLATPADVYALAQNGIYLDETIGPIYVSHITSNTSDIYILSDGSILNGDTDGSVNLLGNNINLTSNNGGIGSSTRNLVVNNRNGVNTVSGTAAGTPTGNSLDMLANGSIYLEERSGDLISSSLIKSLTGNVNLQVTNGSAWINAINVAPFGNPATTNLGASQNKTVTILVQGDVLNVNTILSPAALTMTVLPSPGYQWTTTPGTDTIRVGQADVFNTITARADNIYLPQVYALTESTNTNDLARQTNGLHFYISGYGNPWGLNRVKDLAGNVNINVAPCPKGCSAIPAVVFNSLFTNNANITVGEQWLETVNTIIGSKAIFTTPYQIMTVTPISPKNYAPFYLFSIGNGIAVDTLPNYWLWMYNPPVFHPYTPTQSLNQVTWDLLKYY
jgi:hypothetical protein